MENEKLETIYRQYRRLVLDVAYSVLDDFHLAQDVCQDVFIKMSPERVANITTEKRMRNYLCMVTKHRALDCQKLPEMRKEIPMDIKPSTVVIENSLEYQVCMEDFTTELFEQLRAKNEQWYEIIVRIDVYDEPQEIVARQMDISYSLLRTKYHRARSWIKRNFESEYKYIKWF